MKELKILVTGSNSQIGKEIKTQSYKSKFKFIFSDRENLDITRFDKVRAFLKNNNFDFVINCASFNDVQNSQKFSKICYLTNHLAVENLAILCKKLNIGLIHFSTDYVFDGKKQKPYCENDLTNPISVYGDSKLKGENSMINLNPANSIILRTSWLYSDHNINFITKIQSSMKFNQCLKVVDDQIGTPTNVNDLVSSLFYIIPQINFDRTRIFHFSNEGFCSRFQYAKKLFEIIGIENEIIPVKSSDFGKIIRPNYSVLSKQKIKNNFNLDILDWESSLTNFINK